MDNWQNLGIIILIILFFWALFFPEKVDKWKALLAGFFSFLGSRVRQARIASDIQSNINEARKKMNNEAEILPKEMKIRWSKETTPEAIIEEDLVIIKMKKFESQARNFAYATFLYADRCVIPEARRYVNADIDRSIVFTVSRKILEIAGRAGAQHYFNKEIFDPEVSRKSSLGECYKKMENLVMRGLFTLVFIHELQILGEIMQQRVAASDVLEETAEFLETLNGIAIKEPRVEAEKGLEFLGNKIRVGLVLIALPGKTFLDYVPAVSILMQRKSNSIYLLAIGEENISIARTVKAHFKDVQLISLEFEKRFTVQSQDMKKSRDAVCILFRLK